MNTMKTRFGRVSLALTTLALMSAANGAFAQSFTPGNLVVSRLGTGAAVLTSAGQAEFLDQYSVAGTFVNSLALPTAASGANLPIVDSGTGTSDGTLTRSTNGQFLTIQGYAATPGTTGVTGTASSATNRVIARIGANGAVDTTTGLTDAYSTNNIRSSVEADLSNGSVAFYTGGTGTNPGVRVVSGVGATTSIQVSAGATTNYRNVNIFNGQVYGGTASGTPGIYTIGTGLPTDGTGATTLVAATGTGSSPYDFVFTDANTLYVADDRAVASGGGLQKYTFSGGAFTLAYTLNTGLTSGLRGLTSVTANGVTTLYAIDASDGTGGIGGNKLVAVTDTGASSAFTTLATAGTNEIFRGVGFAPVTAPEPSSVAAMLIGAGLLGLVAVRRRRAA